MDGKGLGTAEAFLVYAEPQKSKPSLAKNFSC